MKHLFKILSSPKHLLVFCLASVNMGNGATGQIFKSENLSGLAESPPNNSSGTGSAIVTISGSNMRVQANFNGLSGNTTVTHIHAPTSIPGTGTAGVVTNTPTFPGFPTGVTSGTYDMTFDMTMASSYNPSYVNNFFTPEAAFEALKLALKEGKAYFNIHSTLYPAGEIRGFLDLQTFQIASSMATFPNLTEAIANATPGATIIQIYDAVEQSPIELPSGIIFEFPLPFTFLVNIP